MRPRKFVPGEAPAEVYDAPTIAPPAPLEETEPELELFFDGACPICRREVKMIRTLDREGKIRLTDIAAAEFEPTVTGIPYAQLMDRIHARVPADGTFVEGVEVFRRIYAALGLGWLATITRAPLLSGGLELAYRIFAKNRLKLTGRCESDVCATGGRA